MSSTLLLPPRAQLCNRSCSNKTHTHLHYFPHYCQTQTKPRQSVQLSFRATPSMQREIYLATDVCHTVARSAVTNTPSNDRVACAGSQAMLSPYRVSGRAEQRPQYGHHPVVRLGCTGVSCARARVVAVKVHADFFAAALRKRTIMNRVVQLCRIN